MIVIYEVNLKTKKCDLIKKKTINSKILKIKALSKEEVSKIAMISISSFHILEIKNNNVKIESVAI